MTTNVYEVTVEFRRRVTPKEYEHAEAFGRLSAQVEGENVAGVLDTLLSTAKTAVLTHLGQGAGPTTAKAEAKPAAPKAKPAPATPEPAAPEPEKGEDEEAFLEELTPEPEPETEEVDDKTLMEVANRAVKKVGPKPVKDLLARYDAGKLSQLSAEERVRFVKELEGMLNGKPS